MRKESHPLSCVEALKCRDASERIGKGCWGRGCLRGDGLSEERRGAGGLESRQEAFSFFTGWGDHLIFLFAPLLMELKILDIPRGCCKDRIEKCIKNALSPLSDVIVVSGDTEHRVWE